MSRLANRREKYRHYEQCRHCGCTEDTACELFVTVIAVKVLDAAVPTFHNSVSGCKWRDQSKRCCTNPECMEKEDRRMGVRRQ